MARIRRKTKGSSDGETDKAGDSVDLSGQEHAWWATRPRLQHTYGYAGDSDAPDAPESTDTPGESWDAASILPPITDGPISDPDAGGPDPSVDNRSLAEVFGEESAYRELGLEPGVPWEEVVAAHRRIAKQYHPDRLVHADPVTRADGEQKMREANAAYEKLRKQPRTQTSGLFSS